MSRAVADAVHRYHDGTKHHFNRFARSLGYLDWASQPRPFRSFPGATAFPLFPSPQAPAYAQRPSAYETLFDRPEEIEPFSAPALGDLLRHALGLSAWKQYRESRWALRVNPSSGNLHPTEAYVACGRVVGLADSPAVYHYAADRHALEMRCAFGEHDWTEACAGSPDVVLVALTSIHWREAWKYGERAFRYCQHDLGHAIAALVVAAAIVGWRARMLPAWSRSAIAALTGVDRGEDFIDAEPEEPGCLLAVGPGEVPRPIWNGSDDLVGSIRTGKWAGRANQLSEDHVQWTFIDEIARATGDPGRAWPASPAFPFTTKDTKDTKDQPGFGLRVPGDARALVLQRRSALAFDGQSFLERAAFLTMLSRVLPGAGAPWDMLWWTPRVHLALFVHRVNDVAPGLYLLARRDGAVEGLRACFGREFLWEPAGGELPLLCLAQGDCRRLAERLSCDQAIAGDGFFSLGMIAEFDASLEEYGPSFYRHLFWESGFLGQFLYLEAEAAAARSTGIGCFYDDPVHDVLGLQGHACQSLYHFTVGIPVDDTRLTTERGYAWER